MEVDFTGEYSTLIVVQQDKPGVIAHITNCLSEKNVNIAYMKLYREEEHDLVLDVYSPLKECILQGKEECLESLLVRNDSKCRVSDRIELKESQGKILQICHSQGRVKVE